MMVVFGVEVACVWGMGCVGFWAGRCVLVLCGLLSRHFRFRGVLFYVGRSRDLLIGLGVIFRVRRWSTAIGDFLSLDIYLFVFPRLRILLTLELSDFESVRSGSLVNSYR